MSDFSIAVVPRTHNSYGTGSNPVGRTKHLSSEPQMAHQNYSTVLTINPKGCIIGQCSGGEIGRHKRLKIFRSQGHAGSIPARSTKNKLKSS